MMCQPFCPRPNHNTMSRQTTSSKNAAGQEVLQRFASLHSVKVAIHWICPAGAMRNTHPYFLLMMRRVAMSASIEKQVT
jgi:hypothetical protein